MGTRITTDEGMSALFDSVSGFAFGPTFETAEQAADFLEFIEKTGRPDPRTLNDEELKEVYVRWTQIEESIAARAAAEVTA
jgi:hypothetical protein